MLFPVFIRSSSLYSYLNFGQDYYSLIFGNREHEFLNRDLAESEVLPDRKTYYNIF